MRRTYRNTERNYYAVIDGNGLRYFIIVNNTHVEVERAVFEAYSSSVRKEMYFEEQYDKLLMTLEHAPGKYLTLPSAEEEILSGIMTEKLNESLSALTEKEQELMILLYVHGYPLRKIAAILGIHFTTVDYWKKKILRKLSESVLQNEHEKDI